MHAGERVGDGGAGGDEAAGVDGVVVGQRAGVGLQVLVAEVVRVVGGADAGARVVRVLLQLDERRLGGVDERRAAAVHLLVQRGRRPVHAQVLLVVRVLPVQRVTRCHDGAAARALPAITRKKKKRERRPLVIRNLLKFQFVPPRRGRS